MWHKSSVVGPEPPDRRDIHELPAIPSGTWWNCSSECTIMCNSWLVVSHCFTISQLFFSPPSPENFTEKNWLSVWDGPKLTAHLVWDCLKQPAAPCCAAVPALTAFQSLPQCVALMWQPPHTIRYLGDISSHLFKMDGMKFIMDKLLTNHLQSIK